MGTTDNSGVGERLTNHAPTKYFKTICQNEVTNPVNVTKQHANQTSNLTSFVAVVTKCAGVQQIVPQQRASF